MADAVAVMSHGRIVEQGSTRQIVRDPKHEETKKLLFIRKDGPSRNWPAERSLSMRYLGRTLVRAILLLAGISILCFLFTRWRPAVSSTNCASILKSRQKP